MLTVHACTHTARSRLLHPHELGGGWPPAGGTRPTRLVSLQDAVPIASPAARRRSWQRSTRMAQSRGPSLCTRTSCCTSLVCIPPAPPTAPGEGRVGSWLAGRPGWALGLQQRRPPLPTLLSPHPPCPWPTPAPPKHLLVSAPSGAASPISPPPSLPHHVRK